MDELITSTENGLYCPVGDFHIDAWGSVGRNIVTHGHSDHAGGADAFDVPVTLPGDGDGTQMVVPGLVAMPVIEVLEVVEVEQAGA